MSNFAMVRLGKDSVDDIRLIDSYSRTPDQPIDMSIDCKQVPGELEAGDYVFLCLGSDNSKGTPTDWHQGLRAFGTVASKDGGPGYNDQWTVEIQVQVVFPRSIKQIDLLAHAAVAYYWCCNIPMIGINTYANQTVQMIKEGEQNQDVRALFYSIENTTPGVRAQICDQHPTLNAYYNYIPSAPQSSAGATSAPSYRDEEVVDSEALLPADWILSLAARGFLIVSGPSGTGKTRSGRDIARTFSYPLGPEYSATVESCKPSTSLAFVSVEADWTDGTPILGFKNMFGPERVVYDQEGRAATTNECWYPPAALRLLLRAVALPDHPHFIIFDEMNLSHVERYFGSFLSVLEANRGLDEGSKLDILTNEEIRLIRDTLTFSGEHPLERETCEGLVDAGSGLTIPDNVFFIGTINVDETTYMFSPKVLDRAHVIEMDLPDPLDYLNNKLVNSPDMLQADEAFAILRKAANRRKNGFWERKAPMEVLKDTVETSPWASDYALVHSSLEKVLAGLQQLLAPVGFGFAYRSMNEVCTYVSTFFETNNISLFHSAEHAGWQSAIDRAVYQKILPKLHGNRRQLGESLYAVRDFLKGETGGYSLGAQQYEVAEEGKLEFSLPKSVAKIQRMLIKLEATGHTTFVE